MNDRQLAPIGALAIREYSAWLARNEARNRLRAFFDRYQEETGDEFVYDEAGPEDRAEVNELLVPVRLARNKLAAARAETRRAIKALTT